MADHHWVNDHIASYLAGGLDAAERTELETHVAACADCSRALAEARQLDQELASLFTPFRPGPDLEDRAIRRLRLQGASRTSAPLGTKTMRFLLAAAAMLLLGLTGAATSYLIGEGGSLFVSAEDTANKERALRGAWNIAALHDGVDALAGVRQLDGVTFDSSASMSVWDRADESRRSHLHFLGDGRNLSNEDFGIDADAPTSYNVDRVEDISVPGSAKHPLGPIRSKSEGRSNEFKSIIVKAEETRTGSLLFGMGKDARETSGESVTLSGQVAPSGALPGALAPPAGTSLGLDFALPTGGSNSGPGEADAKKLRFSVKDYRESGGEGKLGRTDLYYSYRDAGRPDDKPVATPLETKGGSAAGRSGTTTLRIAPVNAPAPPPKSSDDPKPAKEEPPKEDGGLVQAQPEAKAEPKQPEPAAAERKIIRSGELEFEVDGFDSALERVEKIAAEEGGQVATINSDKLPNGKMKGNVVLRVPPRNLDDLIKKLRALGELKRQRLGSQDVTKLYYDIDSRLKAARVMEKRLLEIIAKGGGQVKDLIEAEKELGIWRTRIEELEGEVRYYNNLVGMATLTIHLTEKDIRSAYAVVENRKVDLGIEVEDVEAAQRQAQELIAQAKARVTRAELRKGEAGSFQAILHFESAPEAAGPLLDALKQIGTVTRQEVDQSQDTEGGVKRPLDAKVIKADVRFQLSLFNLATAAPEQTVHVSLACADVEAAYKQILARADKAALRVLASNLDQSRADQATASLAFEVKTPDADGILALIKQAGEVMRLQEVETQGGGHITKAKRGFKISFHSLAAVKPREIITLGLVATNVPRSYQLLQDAVTAAKGRTLEAQLQEQDSQNVEAKLYFDIRRGDEAAIAGALAKAGASFARSVQRDTSDDALDSKVGYRIHIINQSALKPRETVVLGIEVQEVERTVTYLTSLVDKAKGRTVTSNVSRNRAGEVSARVIYDVPLRELHLLAEEFKREGHVLVQDAARNPQVPDNELALGRLEVTLASPRPIIAGDEGFAAAMRNGLAKSASILFTCLVFVVAGLIVTSPIWIGLLIWLLIRRRGRKAEATA